MYTYSRGDRACAGTADLRTKILDVRGFDSSRLLILRGGIPRPIGNSPESLSQAILVGIILVGTLGVFWSSRQASPELHETDSLRATARNPIFGPQGPLVWLRHRTSRVRDAIPSVHVCACIERTSVSLVRVCVRRILGAQAGRASTCF